MKRIAHVANILIFVLLPVLALGQGRTWDLSIAGGAVHNFRTPQRIYQADSELIQVNASYRTEPFTPPVYYDIRLTSWKQEKGWELKFTHHKLILNNKPQEVQRFSITDGFNLLTLNRLWHLNGFIWSAGGGVVITHSESTIRNKPFPENRGILNEGYYVSGPTLETAVARRFYFAERWFVFGEGRVTASYVQVPVADGHARVTNAAVHLLLGAGVRLQGSAGKPSAGELLKKSASHDLSQLFLCQELIDKIPDLEAFCCLHVFRRDRRRK